MEFFEKHVFEVACLLGVDHLPHPGCVGQIGPSVLDDARDFGLFRFQKTGCSLFINVKIEAHFLFLTLFRSSLAIA